MAVAEYPVGIVNPKAVSFIAGTGVSLAYTDLTPDEIDIFDNDLVKLAGAFSQERDLQSIFLEDRDTYLFACAIAKKQLNAGFGGVCPGSGEFGMQLIRPKTVLGRGNWFQYYASAGWNDVFGSAAAPVDLSTTSATYGNPQNRVLLCFPKLVDYTIPKIGEVWFHIGPSDYPIWPIRLSHIGTLFIARLPATPLIVKNGKFYMRGNVEASGVMDGLAPLGLAFCLAEYMTGAGQE
jgi:hypothetical protein